MMLGTDDNMAVRPQVGDGEGVLGYFLPCAGDAEAVRPLAIDGEASRQHGEILLRPRG